MGSVGTTNENKSKECIDLVVNRVFGMSKLNEIEFND